MRIHDLNDLMRTSHNVHNENIQHRNKYSTVHVQNLSKNKNKKNVGYILHGIISDTVLEENTVQFGMLLTHTNICH